MTRFVIQRMRDMAYLGTEPGTHTHKITSARLFETRPAAVAYVQAGDRVKEIQYDELRGIIGPFIVSARTGEIKNA